MLAETGASWQVLRNFSRLDSPIPIYEEALTVSFHVKISEGLPILASANP